MGVVVLQGVTKSFSKRRSRVKAVDGLDLEVGPGLVHGFLGPNGSGKTTTIRMILGLVTPDSGEIRVLGESGQAGLARVVGGVGAIVEKPQLFPSFSARRNLEVLAPLGGVSDARITECLELVGLREHANDRAGSFSLGMLQRLAIAAALLKRPQLLVLDEPTNGLDPAGMVEVRELITRLGTDGNTTVFLSSHLLNEVQQVCSMVSVIDRGRLVTTSRVADLVAHTSPGVRVEVGDPHRAVEVLSEAGLPARLDASGVVVADAAAARVNEILGTAGLWASAIYPVEGDLEQAYLRLTEGGVQ